MPLSAPIALGFTAEIYAWDEGQVLKLFNRGISRSTVETEANLTHIVHATGLPVPAVGEIVEIDGRFGLEYERVDGITMLQAFIRKPWSFQVFARQLAELQADMHQRRVPEMPSQREKLARRIYRAEKLSENVRQAALKALELLPEDDKLCHGDFHPNNIMLTSHGPIIIDWIDASRGSPVVDVGRSTLLFGGGPLPPGTPAAWLVKILRRWFYLTYLRRYFQLNPADRQQLSSWIPVVAAARLNENILAEEARLLSIAQKLISSI
ncbi:MAG: aminoglycoside phosphotransferase family protein [Anaerolineales bacterium]